MYIYIYSLSIQTYSIMFIAYPLHLICILYIPMIAAVNRFYSHFWDQTKGTYQTKQINIDHCFIPCIQPNSGFTGWGLPVLSVDLQTLLSLN